MNEAIQCSLKVVKYCYSRFSYFATRRGVKYFCDEQHNVIWIFHAVGNRAFAVFGPMCWNSTLSFLKSSDYAGSYCNFCEETAKIKLAFILWSLKGRCYGK